MKYLLVLILSVFFFALTYSSAPTEFTLNDIFYITCLLAVVLLLEFFIVHLFSGYRIVQNMILSGFTTINILYLNLILSDSFNHQPVYGQIFAIILAVFILFSFMNMLDESTRVAIFLPAVFALSTVGVLVQTFFLEATANEVSNKYSMSTAENIRFVEFRTKPNVYFIAFDSLIPKAILQKHLGLKSTAYHEVLDANFRRFNNFFADYAYTKPSLNALLALDKGYYNKAVENKIQYNFFPGLTPSPLFEIFKYNGYETTVYHKSYYFGTKKGPYVDNYLVNKQIYQSALCQFIDYYGWRSLTFMGYCRLQNSQKIHQIISGLGVINNDIDVLINYMHDGLKKDKPQLFVSYIYSPGHTDSKTFHRKADEALDDYRDRYFSNSKITASYLINIINFITKEDPEAIVYVFGDHGPFISRGEIFDDNGAFFVQDIFSVFGGIYPQDRCSESFDRPYNNNFITVTQGAHIIIKCLTGGRNAFITLDDYHLPEIIPKEQNNYENYLYD